MKLEIKICGTKGSGKSIMSRHIQKLLKDLDLNYETKICENINTENIEIILSQHDIKFLADKN